MADRYVCIHGHFYQPPRENAWLEAIERQESAFPDHDWNARITDECYGPNARARALDDKGWVVDIASNYARMSFNFGPTLLAWMQEHAPEVYAQVIDADRESAERFGGHGSAMAQAYNHMIMPLCNDRDRRTQVIWGKRDFVKRFGREPAGMWLPETAANTASLEALAEHGIRFTVLAPRQAASVRPLSRGGKGEGEWQEVHGRVDPSTPYLCRLPSGREIVLFFYDGPISQGVAFEGLLHSGERFASRLMDAFDDARTWPQLAHIATDGETYGHHHRHGEMALAAALNLINSRQDVGLTNYAQFLAMHPPTNEARIIENSSWSCVHGVGRWKTDCGCHSGAHSDWHQAWRGPLREALDWLRDSAASKFEKEEGRLFKDPWAARDAYIDVVLDRTPESLAAFEAAQAFAGDVKGSWAEADRVRALKLMELQRHAMLMYTSCGWFFDDISGIETVQVIQYAGRVIQLARDVLGTDFEPEFLSRIESARGNVPGRADGKQVYLQAVKPAEVDLLRVGAHYGVSTLFEHYGESERVYCYDVAREDFEVRTAGRARLAVGRARITSRITHETELLSFGVLHLGDHTLNCGVRAYQGPGEYAKLLADAGGAFDRADFAAVLRHMDRAFGSANYSIGSLFRDEQHKVVRHILEPTLGQIDGAFRQTYEQHAPLLRFLRSLDLHVPRRLQFPADFVLNQALRAAFAADRPDLERISQLLKEAGVQGVVLEGRNLSFALEHTMERLIRAIGPETPVELIAELEGLVRLSDELPFDVDLWQVQDVYHGLRREMHAAAEERRQNGGADGNGWVAALDGLGTALRVRIS